MACRTRPCTLLITAFLEGAATRRDATRKALCQDAAPRLPGSSWGVHDGRDGNRPPRPLTCRTLTRPDGDDPAGCRRPVTRTAGTTLTHEAFTKTSFYSYWIDFRTWRREWAGRRPRGGRGGAPWPQVLEQPLEQPSSSPEGPSARVVRALAFRRGGARQMMEVPQIAIARRAAPNAAAPRPRMPHLLRAGAGAQPTTPAARDALRLGARPRRASHRCANFQ